MANFQRPIAASPDAECQLLSDTAARRERKMIRKYATMRVLGSCYAVSATGPPGGCDVEVRDDMRNSFDG
jgi:hypothetical protein